MEEKPERAIGAVLAGGLSSRMGRDKASTEFNGKPMLEHVLAAVRAAGCEPLVLGRETTTNGAVAVPDDIPGKPGPAAGLLTALRRAGNRDVFLVATDQPLLRPRTVRELLARPGDAVAPIGGGVRQATCAVYRGACLAALEGLLGARPSLPLQRLLEDVATTDVGEDEWTRWGEDGRSWWSLDTAGAVAEAEQWMRQASGGGRREPNAGLGP